MPHICTLANPQCNWHVNQAEHTRQPVPGSNATSRLSVCVISKFCSKEPMQGKIKASVSRANVLFNK